MNNFLKKAVAKLMREVADKIESGNCELSEDQAMDIISALSHEVLSKDEACGFQIYDKHWGKISLGAYYIYTYTLSNLIISLQI